MTHFTEEDRQFMAEAMKEAEIAYQKGEVPVGAIVVRNGEILARGHNTREHDFSAIAHAEITAISNACKALGSWRLEGCTLYVTLEPCPMCAGAIINARIPRVIFGAHDASMGAFGSVMQMARYPLPINPRLSGGLLAKESGEILTRFFREQRKLRS